MTAPVYLGVDGGGTKTAFALIDATGSVVGREVLGGSYFVGDPRGIAALHEVLAAGVERLLGPIARTGLAAAFLGLPGFGESPGDVPLINAAVADVLPGVDFWCDNDMVSAWAGAFAGGDGIAVIGGTGAMSLRPLADRNGPGRRLGGGLRRRGLRVLDRRPGAERLVPDERRTPDAGSVARTAPGSARVGRRYRSHRPGPQPLARRPRRHRRAGTDDRGGRRRRGRRQFSHPGSGGCRAGPAGHHGPTHGWLRPTRRRSRCPTSAGCSGRLPCWGPSPPSSVASAALTSDRRNSSRT